MLKISDYSFVIEQQSELIEAIDWQEIWPVKQHLIVSVTPLEFSIYSSIKEMIKD